MINKLFFLALVFFVPVFAYADTASSTPSSAVNNTGVGTIGWSSASNALTCNSSGASLSDLDGGETSNYLLFSDFDLDVPVGSTIEGVEVSIHDGDGNFNKYVTRRARLYIDGVVSTAETKGSLGLLQSPPYGLVELGGSTDLWSTTLTSAQVNASNFGFVYYMVGDTSNSNPQVDCGFITVYFTPPPPFPPDGAFPVAWTVCETVSTSTTRCTEYSTTTPSVFPDIITTRDAGDLVFILAVILFFLTLMSLGWFFNTFTQTRRKK